MPFVTSFFLFLSKYFYVYASSTRFSIQNYATFHLMKFIAKKTGPVMLAPEVSVLGICIDCIIAKTNIHVCDVGYYFSTCFG